MHTPAEGQVENITPRQPIQSQAEASETKNFQVVQQGRHTCNEHDMAKHNAMKIKL